MLRTVAALAATGIASTAIAGSSTFFALSDHPDGNAAPPGYGLRFDGLFAGQTGAGGGITTFSFDAFGDTIMEVASTGTGLAITITGTLYGGEDAGSGYGFGEGSYALSMSYTVGVAAQGTGYVVTADDPANAGTLTALTGAAMGQVFSIADFSSPSFQFLQDDHRLGGRPEAGQGFWVGRGWLQGDEGPTRTRDFLFLGEMISGPPIIPLPASGAMALAGVGFVATRRRR